jgi:hypothetical protein
MPGVIGYVSRCSSVAGRACSRPGGSIGCRACGGVGRECGFARFHHCQIAALPSAPGFDGMARPLVLRVHFLEVREHVPGAIAGPGNQ